MNPGDRIRIGARFFTVITVHSPDHYTVREAKKGGRAVRLHCDGGRWYYGRDVDRVIVEAVAEAE